MAPRRRGRGGPKIEPWDRFLLGLLLCYTGCEMFFGFSSVEEKPCALLAKWIVGEPGVASP